jgi:hypothetical protein
LVIKKGGNLLANGLPLHTKATNTQRRFFALPLFFLRRWLAEEYTTPRLDAAT